MDPTQASNYFYFKILAFKLSDESHDQGVGGRARQQLRLRLRGEGQDDPQTPLPRLQM